MKYSKALRRSTALALIAYLSAASSLAQEVRIISKDGAIDLTGTLLSSDKGMLRLMTSIGEIAVEQNMVICEGAACPAPIVFDYAFSLTGPGDVAEVLIPILFDGFAIENDAEVVLLDENGFEVEEDDFSLAIREGARIPLRMIDYDGEEIANFGIQQSEGSGSEGFELLAARDVAMVFTEELAATENVQLVAQSGGGDLASFEQEIVVAVDGLTVIGNPDNPLASIAVPQAAAIFGGQITNWSEVGGPNAPINVYAFAEGSEANHDAEKFLLEPFGYGLSRFAKIVQSPRELTAAVTSDPNAIAVVGFRNKRNARAIPLANECGMVVPASPFTIKTEEYPLERRILAYSRADTSGLARDFVEHLQSPALDGLVSKAGFIDLSIVFPTDDYAAQRVETALAAPLGSGERAVSTAMIEEMQRTKRLSTTFRFAPGSSILNNRARRDLVRMVDFIDREKPQNVYVVGFADSAGAFSDNQRLSEQRARQVASEIAATATNGELDGVNLLVRGYSELAPVACNESLEGRAINRRVEIWVE